jgi:hypothetical protein
MKVPEPGKPTHSYLLDEARDAARAFYELAQLPNARKASNELLARVLKAGEAVEKWNKAVKLLDDK